MPLTTKSGSIQRSLLLAPDLDARVSDYADERGSTVTRVVEAALLCLLLGRDQQQSQWASRANRLHRREITIDDIENEIKTEN